MNLREKNKGISREYKYTHLYNTHIGICMNVCPCVSKWIKNVHGMLPYYRKNIERYNKIYTVNSFHCIKYILCSTEIDGHL